jgi:phospholipase/carboxylesterase
MKHIFHKGTNGKTLFLLHGTGGNEEDLIPIGKHMDPHANLLSVRGNVLEYGMPRFFKRLAMGVFDIDSLKEETENLYEYLQEAANDYQFDPKRVTVIGYSNGANIALSVMFTYEKAFKKAILFHPMIPIKDLELPKMKNMPIFIGAGTNDQMVGQNETNDLVLLLQNQQANVKLCWTNQGHQLNKDEILEAKFWYDRNEKGSE